MARVWLVYGPPHCLAELRDGKKGAERRVNWTIHKDAKIGDGVLFYLKAPVCAIVASGCIVTKPQHEDWTESFSRAMPFASMMHVEAIYDPPIGYREMVEDEFLYENWGLLRSQMQSGYGPQAVPPVIIERLKRDYHLVVGEQPAKDKPKRIKQTKQNKNATKEKFKWYSGAVAVLFCVPATSEKDFQVAVKKLLAKLPKESWDNNPEWEGIRGEPKRQFIKD